MTEIKRHLRGPRENLSEELFSPGFKDANLYRRQTAFFQPSILKCWAESIEKIVEDEIKLEVLMAFSNSNSRILRAIKGLQSDKEKSNFLDRQVSDMFSQCLGLAASSSDASNRTKLIKYLYSKKLLEIKLIASFNPDTDELGLAHEKAGYFLKNDGEIILFFGSANESESAFLRQGEHLQVYNSSIPTDLEDLNYFKEDLDKKWNNKDEYSQVFKPSKEIIDRINSTLEITSKEEALDVAREIMEEERLLNQPYFPLREHQKEAVKSFQDSEMRGIFDHATGSGKTYTSVRIIQALRKSTKRLNVVIGVPYISLADQWEDILNEHFRKVSIREGFHFSKVICCHSQVDDPRPYLIRMREENLSLRNSELENKEHLSIFVVVNDTMFSENFKQHFFDEVNFDPNNLFFIGDECHNYTNKNNISYLHPLARFRLGLSATAFDNEKSKSDGEKEMEKYFGNICHRYTLEEGIRDGHLCKYYYHPIECYLDEEEYSKWRDYLNAYDKDEKSESFKKMEEIIDKSKEKYRAFEELVKKRNLTDKSGSIIFCGQGKVDGEKCINYVSNVLDNINWRHHRITFEETRAQRREAISGFVREDIKALTAVRVLDEGIDIPSIKTAIILASSERRRQFIQRRGRVLRNDGDKNKIAEIYDFIILPSAEFTDSGKKLIEREIYRVEQMGHDCLNKDEIKDFVVKWKGLYETV